MEARVGRTGSEYDQNFVWMYEMLKIDCKHVWNAQKIILHLKSEDNNQF